FATLTNVVSYVATAFNPIVDGSSLTAYVGAPANTYVTQYGERKSDRTSDEFRLVSAPGKLEWLVGAFYTHEKDPDNINVRGTDASGIILPSSSPFFNYYTFNDVSLFVDKAA